MPYSPNIPQAGDKLRNSQLDILNNFTAIGSGFALNHVDLNLANAGQHTHLTMPVQSAQPAVAASTLEVYDFLSPDTGFNELYVSKNAADVQSGKTLLNVPMTASVLQGAGASFGNAGWTYLPSGVLIQWGVATSTGPGHTTATVNLTKNFAGSGTYRVTFNSFFNFGTSYPLVLNTGQTNNTLTFTLVGSVPTVGATQWFAKFIAIGV